MYRNVYNIIVAAGNGSRFGGELPKQYCSFLGRPLIMTTIERFKSALPGSHIILVINKEHQSLWESLLAEQKFQSPAIAFGGTTRWESVKNAIDTIRATLPSDAIITIHDGARPMVTPELIHRVIKSVSDGAVGAIPVTAVTESLRIITADGESEPADRSLYRAVQTPQAFNGPLLAKAYELPYRKEFTDDASVMAAAGFHKMRLVDGDPRNIKITHPADIKIAELYSRL